jgi:hypothetical protein
METEKGEEEENETEEEAMVDLNLKALRGVDGKKADAGETVRVMTLEVCSAGSSSGTNQKKMKKGRR